MIGLPIGIPDKGRVGRATASLAGIVSRELQGGHVGIHIDAEAVEGQVLIAGPLPCRANHLEAAKGAGGFGKGGHRGGAGKAAVEIVVTGGHEIAGGEF